jgi:hypothetical protein|tara:strand:- start:4393 stop:4650 length:258 start_codon:yes stop_codon:yes gene_type:complete
MYIKQIIETINLLKVNHPKISIGKHIATALDGENIWSLTDKEFASLLDDYQSQLDAVEVFDENFDVDKIIEDSMDLTIDGPDELY